MTLLTLLPLALAQDPSAPPPEAPAPPAAPPAPTPTEAPTGPPAEAPAQPPAETPPAPVYPRLPILLSTVPAAYPPDALAVGASATVLLEIGVDATGRVAQTRVTEAAVLGCVPEATPLPCDAPGWAAFDAAAAAAVRDYRFDPALDATGTPTSAALVYRYRFDAERAPALSLTGRVVDADTSLPLPELELVLEGPTGARQARTDTDGGFSLAGLADGPWKVSASAAGYVTAQGEVVVREGVVAQVDLRLEPSVTLRADEVIEVTAERRSLEVTERRISAEEIRYLPGTGGDVVRAVQNLPGVARAPLGVGQLIIRGTPPEDSSYFLDGANIPIVFHFAGFSTILNSDAIAEVAYLPGNYSVRYGRTLGGVVDLRTRDELPDASHGYLSVDLIQATLYAEQKLGERWAVTLSGRRSYVDAILNPILNATSDAPIRAPRYYDAQLRAVHAPQSGGLVDLLVLVSDDRFRVLADDSDDAGVAIGLSTTFAKARARWTRPLAKGWNNELTALIGPEDQAFSFLETSEAYERAQTLMIREELTRPLSEENRVGWRVGAEVLSGRDAFLYDVTLFSPYEEDSAWFVAPAVYAEPSIQLGPLVATPGLRLDGLVYDNGYATLAVDPRFGSRLTITPSTAIKASVGSYSQFPTLRQVSPAADGNPELHAARSIQTSLGIEERLGEWLSVEGTLFYNHLDELVVGREDRFKFFTGPPPIGPFDTDPYANDGTGRVCGAELLGRLTIPKATALVSVTLSHSSRVNRPGDERELFEYDQPVVFNGSGSRELGKGWRVGVRGRVASGNPYTPVVNRWFDAQNRVFVPVYGEQDSARLPAFWSVDARVDKEWEFRKWSLTTYLDVQNVFNTKNVDVMSWNYDYTTETPINGLPVLPAIGLRGDWGKGR